MDRREFVRMLVEAAVAGIGAGDVLQYWDEDPKASPKFTSVMGWAKKWRQPVDIP